MVQCEVCGRFVDAVNDNRFCASCQEYEDNRTRYLRDSDESFELHKSCYLIMNYCGTCKASLLWVDSDDEGSIFADLASGEWHNGEWRVHNARRCAEVSRGEDAS